jgi:hypothetical protein
MVIGFGPFVLLEQWLCVIVSSSVRGTRSVSV